jgi:phosphoglycerol transferase MdoB-like AlkP superfamily enzyme
MYFYSRYTQVFFALVISFGVMLFPRLLLWFKYPEDFADLTVMELFSSFFMGFRVDMITLFTFFSLIILLLTLPAKWVHNRSYRMTLGAIWGFLLSLIFAVSVGDVLYFDFTHRHISNELFNLGNDYNLITEMALNSYLHFTLGALVFFTLLIWFFLKLFGSPIQHQELGKKSWIAFLLVILLLFLGIRNTLSGKSFGISDAYAVNKVSSGNIALNGFFCVYRTSGKSRQSHKLMPLEKAVAETRQMLATPNAPFIDEQKPLMRRYHNGEKSAHNVVIVLLESWGAEHIDGFTRYKELGVTPYFKKMAGEGLKFTNFYANGYRSIFGITSLFTGITLPAGFQYLGKGLELSSLSYLGSIAKANGYSTLAMQGGNRRSYRVDSVTHISGFDEYYGAEDMPNVEEVEGDRAPHTGTYDYNLLDFYHKKLNTLKEPFMGFAFTSTNHTDFHLPHSKFERYPHDLKNYYGALNAYIYVDNAIERFMEGVKKEPWFDNTIFIFTADHGSGDAATGISKELRQIDKPLPSIEHFRTPLVIYAPKIFSPREIETLGSQSDMMPTLLDILGLDTPFTALGNSLFDQNVSERFVYFYAGNLIGLITDEGYVKYNFKNIVESSGSKEAVKRMREQLFAVDTAEAGLLDANRWYQ